MQATGQREEEMRDLVGDGFILPSFGPRDSKRVVHLNLPIHPEGSQEAAPRMTIHAHSHGEDLVISTTVEVQPTTEDEYNALITLLAAII